MIHDCITRNFFRQNHLPITLNFHPYYLATWDKSMNRINKNKETQCCILRVAAAEEFSSNEVNLDNACTNADSKTVYWLSPPPPSCYILPLLHVVLSSLSLSLSLCSLPHSLLSLSLS